MSTLILMLNIRVCLFTDLELEICRYTRWIWPLITFYLTSEQTSTKKKGMPLFAELQLKNINYVLKAHKIKWSLDTKECSWIFVLFFNKSSFSQYTGAVSVLLFLYVFWFLYAYLLRFLFFSISTIPLSSL